MDRLIILWKPYPSDAVLLRKKAHPLVFQKHKFTKQESKWPELYLDCRQYMNICIWIVSSAVIYGFVGNVFDNRFAGCYLYACSSHDLTWSLLLPPPPIGPPCILVKFGHLYDYKNCMLQNV